MSTTTRVDFYILAASNANSRLQFACRLTEKAYSLQHRVYAHASSLEEARQLDEMLWTFRQGSFIPHFIMGEAGDARHDEHTPVKIGMPENCLEEGELLINLSGAAPGFATGYARVAEVVDGQETSRQAGRTRFRQYREMGLEPVTHHID